MQADLLQRIALDVAQAHSVERVLRGVVEGIAADQDVALARIWLLGPGDLCDDCRMRSQCPDRTTCLHLAASAGRSIVDPSRQWRALDGLYRRFPLNVRKVGRIAGTGQSELLVIQPQGTDWMADPGWAADEGLQCFAGHPLVFRGEVLGVLAMFSRVPMDEESFGWLRTFADQAAVAIANARAFEQLDKLREQLELERDYLREEFRVAQAFEGIVGTSAAMRNTLHQIEMVAPSDANVLILGESGTGKELIASAIHERSARRDRPMVRVNCASVPRELFESEFFGHVRGAFTGASQDRAGRFQVADGGTLFLDEVAEIPPALQGKLLRVLQEGQLSPVGSDRERSVDVRLIAATNQDLRAAVEEKRFREDLYYRLSVFPLQVPPLRDRAEDIPLLAAHFLVLAARKMNCSETRLPMRVVNQLKAYDWPGNVRELQNVIERAVITSRCGQLFVDLPLAGGAASLANPASAFPAVERETLADTVFTEAEMRQLERENILRALQGSGWRISGPDGAAARLGMKPTTLASRVKKMGIEKPRPPSV